MRIKGVSDEMLAKIKDVPLDVQEAIIRVFMTKRAVRGGNATKEKYGLQHYTKMIDKRWKKDNH